jgi:hypothetical protein
MNSLPIRVSSVFHPWLPSLLEIENMNCQSRFYRGCNPTSLARRWFLQQCGVGLGAAALAELSGTNSASAAPLPAGPLAPKAPHFAGKAKSVIYLFMAGAPSHLELFDNKPELAKWDGKLPPAELLEGYRAAFINPESKLLGPKFKFARHGQSGAELSELLPHLAGVQPRAGADHDEHRLTAVWPAELRCVDHVWAGLRVAGPAGVRRLQHRQ